MILPFESINDNAEQHPVTAVIPKSEGNTDSSTTPNEDIATLETTSSNVDTTSDPELLKRVMLMDEKQQLEEETEREHHEIEVQELYRQIAVLHNETSELRLSVAIMENEVKEEQDKKNLIKKFSNKKIKRYNDIPYHSHHLCIIDDTSSCEDDAQAQQQADFAKFVLLVKYLNKYSK